MRANEYALNSSAYRSASAPIQQALRTHLDEAAELLRDLRDLHHDYPEPEVRWPLAGALRDCGHSLGEVGRLEEARRLLHEVKGLSAGHPDPFMGSILLEAFLDPAFGPLWEGHDARKIFARFTALLYENRRAEAAISTLRWRICWLARWRMKTSLWMSLRQGNRSGRLFSASRLKVADRISVV